MKQNELAALLGISPAAVTKLKKRGMPTDTLARAERWRRKHLEPGRIKGQRFDTIGTKGGDPVAVVKHWIEAALLDFNANREGLARALDAVPDERMEEVKMPQSLARLFYADEEARMLASIAADPGQNEAALQDLQASGL